LSAFDLDAIIVLEGLSMFYMPNVLRAGLIGTTALMTVIAGLPQFACACPGKSAQPIAATKALVERACSCGGSCCASAAEQGQKKPCCQNESRTSTATPSSGSLAWQTTCKVALAPAAVFVSPSSAQVWSPDSASPLPLAILPTPADGSFASWNCAAWLLPHHTPPPDLVTILHRFLI
jgi:hypothetical protein